MVRQKDVIKDIPDIEIGAILQDEDFLEAANNLVEQSGMTADQANAYFAGIGYEPVYSVTDVEAPGALDTNTQTTSYLDNFSLFNGTETLDMGPLGSYEIPKINPNISWHNETKKLDPTAIESTIPLTSFSGDSTPPKIKGMRRKATGAQNNYSSSNAGGKSPGSGNKKSGGSSAPKHKTKENKNRKNEIERYHDVTKALEDVTAQLDMVGKAKDRAFGAGKLKNIKSEIK